MGLLLGALLVLVGALVVGELLVGALLVGVLLVGALLVGVIMMEEFLCSIPFFFLLRTFGTFILKIFESCWLQPQNHKSMNLG